MKDSMQEDYSNSIKDYYNQQPDTSVTSNEKQQLSKPQFLRMNSATPALEAHSATKKPLISKLKSDIVQIEQEFSHSQQTLGHTPTQIDRTPPYRSSAKRRKISDDPFVSLEKQQQQ